MKSEDAFNSVLSLFERYYNINTDDVVPPFSAEAEFASHNEQYYLVKAAKVADINTKEFVYFAKCGCLGPEELMALDNAAWERGIAKVVPGYDHRNTDITLIIVAESINKDTAKLVKKMRHYKSWKLGIYGWSNYRLVAIGCNEGKAWYNYQGRTLKKLVGNILCDK